MGTLSPLPAGVSLGGVGNSKFLTPNYGTDIVVRTIVIPAYLLPVVTGLMLDAANVEAWEKYGDADPAQCAEDINAVIASIQDERQ